ncbi:nicotinate-nucleotide--dimethylbenzimidazole phosphoribosyltransferase [Sphingomonas carotinifaciens]|uniref:Nicotinate-nucleotide--dimethylbenzimidazole phosphoribosyltransferase n=1 Tax=Sphingomonas carotinifaciens TaxID=1166323 RepID=A0A1G7ISU5_9SPHN|nr:nicotinate-nucleotide--dimethylbenzimidazole phosphoribosyltransferase [Sphingomonas carotinifaciens]MBB4084751.1 nicotinate-nucleotide--dimethylbenzimidazole phosphoribosyltransferase [Sphingomonas carotinifaciens]MWC44138.1 nicotinate-nucleotide--dimethylbenzimidazole phosphoribosyltransferase [Sphingomonas carotinifaciens]SDF15743.1 nicotinate-nucleotide-dimethylbenzimidazole phosphoribosyltransferase [Sphingomonas carotinifaciens]
MIAEAEVRAHLDALAKPRGAMGRLEDVAVRLALSQGWIDPETRPRQLVLFAGDHGCVDDGVSAWPSAVTGVMVGAILGGRATSNALAAAQDCALRLVDVGVAGPRTTDAPAFFRDARVGDGTASLARGPAMSVDAFEAAWAVGADEARRAVGDGAAVLIAGEMGIGNTTPAACLTALITGIEADAAVGRGAGADDAVMAAKRAVVAGAVARARGEGDARAAIAGICGYEIAAMAGFYAEGARAGVTLLIDGYVATAAALVAERLAPGTARAMIAAHRSAEPGHAAALAALGLAPMLEWDMRLGEGSGALVALPLLDSAAALLRDVARLDAIGVGRAD